MDIQMTEREYMETEVIRRLLKSYFDIVCKKIVDSIPKVRAWRLSVRDFSNLIIPIDGQAVTLKLIDRAEAEMHDTLVGALYKENLITELLEEVRQKKEDGERKQGEKQGRRGGGSRRIIIKKQQRTKDMLFTR